MASSPLTSQYCRPFVYKTSILSPPIPGPAQPSGALGSLAAGKAQWMGPTQAITYGQTMLCASGRTATVVGFFLQVNHCLLPRGHLFRVKYLAWGCPRLCGPAPFPAAPGLGPLQLALMTHNHLSACGLTGQEEGHMTGVGLGRAPASQSAGTKPPGEGVAVLWKAKSEPAQRGGREVG